MYGNWLRRTLRGILPLLIGLAAPCLAQSSAGPPHHFASLQVLHPLATSGDPETTTNFRLSIFYGRSGAVHGVDLNAVAGVTSGDVQAFQATGLYARTGGIFQGLALTGGVNHLVDSGAGFQFTGLANFAEGSFAGLQASGLLNYTGRAFAGAQVSGLMNINDGSGAFLQLGSVANVNVGPFAGVQISGFMNSANSSTSGGQVAILNYAESMSGFQVGLLNLSEEFHGLKVGFLNRSRKFSGTPIGVINMDATSRREWLFYASSYSLFNIGFRTVLNDWSSILSVGGLDLKGDVDNAWFLGWNFGRNFAIDDRWSLTVDLGMQHVMPQKSDDPAQNDSLHFALQARVLGDYRLKDHLGLFASVGLNSRYADYSLNADKENDVLVSGGVVLIR